jgi:hypothetical protein
MSEDAVRVVGGVLVDGVLSKLVVEQEDHDLEEVELTLPVSIGSYLPRVAAVTYVYNADKSLASETEVVTGIITTYSYNSDGLLDTATTTIPGQSPIVLTYVYNSDGNLSEVV